MPRDPPPTIVFPMHTGSVCCPLSIVFAIWQQFPLRNRAAHGKSFVLSWSLLFTHYHNQYSCTPSWKPAPKSQSTSSWGGCTWRPTVL